MRSQAIFGQLRYQRIGAESGRKPGAIVQLVVALTHSAVVLRHWFEIDMRDASMEHGARIELRELVQQPRRGTESAAQLITADRPLWRADLFDRLTDEPGTFGVAHYHPEFSGNQPGPRVWDTELTASPWRWLHDQLVSCGAGSGRNAWPLDPDDAAELAGLAAEIVDLARQFSPERCHSAAECFRFTRDARESVDLMMRYMRRPDLLDLEWVAPWRAGTI
jgi:hypothetical protein